MALIQCPECKKEISDKSEKCIHCGYPIQKQVVQGKAIFQTSSDPIALLAKYIIKDESGNVIVKLKNNDSFELPVDRDTRLFIRLTRSLVSYKEVFLAAGQITKFKIGTSYGGATFYVTKV